MTHPVSVCMATYNGAKYVREQLESILAELHPDDEIVIVDDASSDDTLAVIDGIDDPRISVYPNPHNLGYVRSFERAMMLATGDVLMLSDQDDIWIPGRRDALVAATMTRPIAASNLVLDTTGEPLRSPISGRPWALRAASGSERVRNELRILAGDAPYFGCTMAVRRSALPLVLPFPASLTESHDLWIATVGNAAGALIHVEQPTLRRRIHADNASSPRPRGVLAALGSRWLLIRLYFSARKRLSALQWSTATKR